MSLQGAQQLVLGFHSRRAVVVEASAAQLSSDGGLLVVREFDERIGLTARLAEALQDVRHPSLTHSLLSMVRQRVYGVLADYEDQNDHDELRSDPVFKLIVVRGDSGYGVPSMFHVCEELRLTYSFGLGMNARFAARICGIIGSGGSAVRSHRPEATSVSDAALSGGDVARSATNRHQVRSARAGHQSPRDRHQS